MVTWESTRDKVKVDLKAIHIKDEFFRRLVIKISYISKQRRPKQTSFNQIKVLRNLSTLIELSQSATCCWCCVRFVCFFRVEKLRETVHCSTCFSSFPSTKIIHFRLTNQRSRLNQYRKETSCFILAIVSTTSDSFHSKHAILI